MSNSSPSAPKKGISGFAIAGFGCGGLVLLAAIGGFMLAGKACSRFSEVTKEMQDNPAKAAALIAVKLNPDLEVVATNDAKHEITIKNKRDGNAVTMSFEDIAKGKFKMSDISGKTISVDGSNVTTGGGIKLSGPDTESVIGGGSISAGTVADGVPLYPGLETGASPLMAAKPGMQAGIVVGTTPDPVVRVTSYYGTKLSDAGYVVETRDLANSPDHSGATLIGKKDDGKTTVTVVISREREGKTNVVVQYERPK